MTDTLKNQLEFLAIADRMKSIERKTLLLDKSKLENDAEHSWHFALMAMTLFEHCGIAGVDINRVMKMAIIHDLVEIYAGDTPAFDLAANTNKLERENLSADKLFGLLPAEQGTEYRMLWEEFDAMQTPDARYANAVDVFQAFYNQYHTDAYGWVTYQATAARVRERMLPVKTALPALWKFVEDAITDSVQRGLLI